MSGFSPLVQRLTKLEQAHASLRQKFNALASAGKIRGDPDQFVLIPAHTHEDGSQGGLVLIKLTAAAADDPPADKHKLFLDLNDVPSVLDDQGRVLWLTPNNYVGGLAPIKFGSMYYDASGKELRFAIADDTWEQIAQFASSARVTHSVAQSINGTVALAFNTERGDNDGFHSNVTNNSRLTVPRSGLYLITCSVAWEVITNHVVVTQIRLNGTTTLRIRSDTIGSNVIYHHLSVQRFLSAGDYVEVVCIEVGTGTINVDKGGDYSPEFEIARIG